MHQFARLPLSKRSTWPRIKALLFIALLAGAEARQVQNQTVRLNSSAAESIRDRSPFARHSKHQPYNLQSAPPSFKPRYFKNRPDAIRSVREADVEATRADPSLQKRPALLDKLVGRVLALPPPQLVDLEKTTSAKDDQKISTDRVGRRLTLTRQNDGVGDGTSQFTSDNLAGIEEQLGAAADSAKHRCNETEPSGDHKSTSTGTTRGFVERQCVCGNIFMDDSVFCRKCGKPRKGGAPSVSQMLTNNSRATALLAASLSATKRDGDDMTGSEEDPRELVKKIIKMDINLLLGQAWKLNPRNRKDAKKLRDIRGTVVGLIQDAYGHPITELEEVGDDTNIFGILPHLQISSKWTEQRQRRLSLEEYVEFANDYFDVSEPTARKMFRRIDLDGNGFVDFDELEHALEPLFRQHATLQELFDNGVKAMSAHQVLLFASASRLSSCDTGMVYLAMDLGVFVAGNFLLICINIMLLLDNYVGFTDAGKLGLMVYTVAFNVYAVYCLMYRRYFPDDWWTASGMWMYTAGYLACIYYSYCDNFPQVSPLLSSEHAEIFGFSLFSIGSIPFFLSFSPPTEHEETQIGRFLHRFRYDHTNAAARGGLLFFIGSVLSLINIFKPKRWSDELSAIVVAGAYASYFWGRWEGLYGLVCNKRETMKKLAAAATWRRLTTGIHLRAPNIWERIVHVLWGKESDHLAVELNATAEPSQGQDIRTPLIVMRY